MKTSTRQLFLSAAIAFFFTLALATFAQETPPASPPPPAPETEKSTPAATPPAEPAAATPAATPAPEPAPAATEPADSDKAAKDAPETVTAPAEPAKPVAQPTEQPKLRRLDGPPDEQGTPRRTRRTRIHHNNGNEVVAVGHDAFLAKDRKADAVVAVFGSATSEGEVQDAVVSVFGDTRATGPVGDAAVAVFGNTYVNSKVGDSVVAVFGTVELGPDAEIGGEVVAIGGTVKRDPKAIVHGQINNVSFGGMLTDTQWLRSWFVNCALYGRLLAFGPHLMWAWWIAIGFLAFYVLLALLFGKGVEKCMDTFSQRPGYSILTAFLTVLLAPVVTIILIMTGVGIVVVPFLAAGLFFAGLFGKAVMLAWLGRRITRLFGVDNVALGVIVGGVIVLGLYTVPILGLVIYKLLGWIGVGVVVYTLLQSMKREKPPASPTSPGSPLDPTGSPLALTASSAGGLPIMSAATLPRAGFWIRTAALVLDTILVGILVAIVNKSGPYVLVVLAAYGACMWRLRGTTIGGIICGLKVVRLDDRELDWSTAVVRALGCFLSFVVIGLGFIWVAFDDQKQSWHDKIAGTTVVLVPKGVSLV